MVVTLNITLLLGLVIFLRTRRDHVIRTRADGYATIALVTVFGILIAPTPLGQGILKALGQAIGSVNGMGF